MQGGDIVTQKDGFSDTNYIYNINSRGEIVVPLTADVTTANIPDNKMYVPLTSSSFVFPLSSLRYMVADPGYDAKELYEYSKGLGIDLVCPVERYESFQKET